MLTFGNEELAESPKLGNEILCPRCGKMHKIIYGKKVLEDGTKVEYKGLAAYKCKGKLILAGVKGRDVTLYQRKH